MFGLICLLIYEVMGLYFGNNNNFESKPQPGNGFNEWDLIKYKPDKDNKGLISSLGIDNTTEWSYSDVVAQVAALSELTADIDSNNVYDNLKYRIATSSSIVSESIRVKKGEYCPNAVYIAYVNELGGLSYELFHRRQEEAINIDDGVTVSGNLDILQTSNRREFTIGANSRKSIKCFKDNILISQKDRYNAFKESIAKKDVLLLNKVFRNDIESISDYNSTFPNTSLVNSPEHGQRSGDNVIIQNTTNYNGQYEILVIDDDNFVINTPFVSDEMGRFQRVMQESDWLVCQVQDNSDDIDNFNTVFSIEIEIFLPTGT